MNHKTILSEALSKSGMNQAQLAEKMNVSKSTVSTNLRRDNIGLDVFVKYMNALGFEVCVGKQEGGMFFAEWNVTPNNVDKRAVRGGFTHYEVKEGAIPNEKIHLDLDRLHSGTEPVHAGAGGIK